MKLPKRSFAYKIEEYDENVANENMTIRENRKLLGLYPKNAKK